MNILFLCTGNSCRSIMAEAIINANFDDVNAYSAGVDPSGKVNPNAKKVLDGYGVWREHYHSKDLTSLNKISFDLVVTVCSHASRNCPVFPRPVSTIYIGFDDPDGKKLTVFEELYREIKTRLLPIIAEKINYLKLYT